MQIYLVGGAVRDQLLGLPVSDRDWVVVGSTPNDLIKLGFQQVGKDFPVFLHPKTREEYALARKERKTNVGYTGFSCYTAPNVTIEEDLLRRDLTINAIAQTEDGKLIDPYHGEQDIKNRLLRHVSNSFTEDPLRILRVARFAARLSKQNFFISSKTQSLMKKMVFNYELNTITPERIWVETKKALQSSSPETYFNILYNCGALTIIFPEINKLFSMFTTEETHLKINKEIDMFLTLKMAASLTDDIETRFAALCYDFIQILSKSKNYYRYYDHAIKSSIFIEAICNRIRIPNKIKELAKLAAEFHLKIHLINLLEPENIIDLFNKLDSWRKPSRINQLSIIYKAVSSVQIEQENITHLQSEFFIEALKIAQQVSYKNMIKKNIKGHEIRDELTKERIKALTIWRREQTILPI
ncbi:MAG: multifunctional CCA addition/repair protein [Arsenophonus sp. ER-BJ3-MAG3]